jgi:MoxR-like ATPase
LPRPFFVIATQNQRTYVGTFPLPESQLDRFMMRLQLGYPDPTAERELLGGENRRALLARLQPRLTPARLLELQQEVERIHAAPALLDYIQALLQFSRCHPEACLGLSPRAGLALLRAARAHALLAGRAWVLPEDVQAVAGPVLEHRLDPEGGRIKAGQPVATQLLETVAVP